MPGGRGGRRKGTPGKGYANRTDLATDYAPSTAEQTPASGGVPPQPQQPSGVSLGNSPTRVAPEDIPKLDDPTGRPDEPVTAGLNVGPGLGKSAFPIQPRDPVIDELRAAYAAFPTPQLAAVIRTMTARYGRL